MIELLEKLISEKFEDTFKPIDHTEQAKRKKEYVAELKTYNSEIFELFIEELIDDQGIVGLIAEAYEDDNLDFWIEAMQSDEFKKNATKRLLEYLEDMIQGFKEHRAHWQEMDEKDETQNM